MPGLPDLPVELFYNNIFPYLHPRDILALGSINRFFHTVSEDEAYWHQMTRTDFNFPSFDTARETGWKFLYQRLSDPKLYVWGERSKGRIGLLNPPQTNVRDGVPFPARLNIPGVHIVSLAAGGMSFHAIDSKGDIYVWGTLDGTRMALRSDGFSEPAQKAEEPVRLQLPVKFRSISCGRLHTTAMDAASDIWTFTSWGRPFRLSSSLVDKSTPETTPVQVESGWSFSTILTESGDVLVYWPFGRRMMDVLRHKDEELESTDDNQLKAAAKAKPTADQPRVVPCYWWVLHGVDPVRLPPIPVGSLPQLHRTGISPEEADKETRLVKIAAFDLNIIGLTSKGHVLRYSYLSDEDTYQTGRWEYLPLFSDIEQVQDLEAFTSTEEVPTPVKCPETMSITHISASFGTFFAYSTGASSIVLMGEHISEHPVQAPPAISIRDVNPIANYFVPRIIPELQHQGVISVVVGDYHYGALTASGRLLTWGSFSCGALGLGDPVELLPGAPGGYPTQAVRDSAVHARWGLMRPPPEVRVPAEVHFDHDEPRKRPKFCFAAAALGWHTGALVIDLDPDQEGDKEREVTDQMPGAFHPADDQELDDMRRDEVHTLPRDPSNIPRLGTVMGRGGRPPFRLGFAARGMRRGGAQ